MTTFFLLSATSTLESGLIGFLTAIAFGAILLFFRKTKEKVSEINTSTALKKDPENTAALKKYGFSAFRKGNLSEAINSFEKILQIKNDDFEAVLGLANSLHLEKQYAKSKIYLEWLSNQDPQIFDEDLPYVTLENLTLYAYFLGHIRFMEGNVDEAKRQKKLVKSSFQVSSEIKNMIDKLNLY